MTELAYRCLAPKDLAPGLTTSLCVYEKAHDGEHSWAHSHGRLAERSALAERRIRQASREARQPS